jgi:D-arabinose 5-phosphate isomerase GutQ
VMILLEWGGTSAQGSMHAAGSHLGLSTPPITSNDLVVASAGPGGLSTVNALCSLARPNGATV